MIYYKVKTKTNKELFFMNDKVIYNCLYLWLFFYCKYRAIFLLQG